MQSRTVKLTPYSIFIVVAVGLFASLFAIGKVYNNDLWWHLKSGQWILENMAAPHFDTFSFSTPGVKWVNSSWLSGPVFLFLFNLGGIDLLILFKALLIGAAFSGACLFMIRRGVNPFLSAIVLGYAVAVCRFRFLLRPTLFMFPMVLALFWVLFDANSLKKHHVLWFVPVVVLWMNLHGSALIAPVFALFLFLEAGATRVFRIPIFENEGPSFKFSAGILLLMTLSVFITPYGIDIPYMAFSRTLEGNLLKYGIFIQEHIPLKWGSYRLYWGLMISCALSFIFAYKRIRVFSVLVFVGTSFLALESVRYIGLAGFLQAILLGMNLQILFSFFPFKVFVPKKVMNFTCCAILISAGWIAFNTTFVSKRVYEWGVGLNENKYPAKAIDHLKIAGYSGNLYNLWEQGGYILWHMPEVKTQFDGRALDEQLLLINKLAEMNFIEFRNYLKSHDIKAALLTKKSVSVEVFEVLPEFILTHFDGNFLVYLHNDLLDPSFLSLDEAFQYVKPHAFDFSYLKKYAETEKSAEVLAELRRAVNALPEDFSLTFQLGYFLELLDRPEAIDVYLRAAELDSALGFSHYKIGVKTAEFALRHQTWDKAVKILTMAFEHGKDSTHHYFLLGTALFQEKNYVKAESALAVVLRREPEQVGAMENMGYLLIDTNRLAKARGFFEDALAVNPESENALYGLAFISQRLKHPDAETLLEKFLLKYPSSRWAHNARQLLREIKR